MKTVSIIIPVFNAWQFTKQALKDLSYLPDNHEIVIVDNGSDDDTVMLSEYKDIKNFKLLKNQKNEGFAKASNRGYQESTGEIVIFLNNDIKVQSDFEGWTTALVKKTSSGCLVGPTSGLLDSNLNFVRESDRLPESGNTYLSGWCLAGERNTFDKLIVKDNSYKGPFDEWFVTYFEDTDLSFRAKQLGIKLEIQSVPVYHFGKMTSRKVGVSNLYINARQKFISRYGK